jgi:hypothetical protein
LTGDDAGRRAMNLRPPESVEEWTDRLKTNLVFYRCVVSRPPSLRWSSGRSCACVEEGPQKNGGRATACRSWRSAVLPTRRAGVTTPNSTNALASCKLTVHTGRNFSQAELSARGRGACAGRVAAAQLVRVLPVVLVLLSLLSFSVLCMYRSMNLPLHPASTPPTFFKLGRPPRGDVRVSEGAHTPSWVSPGTPAAASRPLHPLTHRKLD